MLFMIVLYVNTFWNEHAAFWNEKSINTKSAEFVLLVFNSGRLYK